MKQKRLKP